MDNERLKLARDWAMRELSYCFLNDWSVEFQPVNSGYLKIQISKCGKHAYQIIPISTDDRFYMNIWEAINTLRQDILEEFPYVGT